MSNQDRKAKAQAAARSSGKGANAVIVGGVVVIVAIVLVVGAVVINAVRDSGGASELPQGVAAGEPLEPYAEADPPQDAPVVDLYEDFRCPACKTFEQDAGETVTELAQDGEIRLRIHLKTVIDSITGGTSSAVAGSSAVCALDQGVWTEYHEALFAMQPASETRAGFPEETYTEAAKQAGLSGQALEEFQQCTQDETYVDYVQGVADASAEAGITATPTVVVDGTRFDWGSVIDQQSGEVDTETLTRILTSGDVPEDRVATQ